MTWPAVAYVVLLLAFGVYSAYDDRQDGVGVPYVVTDAAVTLLWVYFVVAYYLPPWAAPVGRAAPVLFALGIAWTAWDVRRNLRLAARARPRSYDPELPARVNLWVDRSVEAAGLVAGTVLMVPAFAAAVRVSLRAWS